MSGNDIQYINDYLRALKSARAVLQGSIGLTDEQIAKAAYANLAIDRPYIASYQQLRPALLNALREEGKEY